MSNLGLGAQTADHWVCRYVRGGSAQKLDWLVVEEITQLDMALWADLACVGLNADVKFLLLGDFRQLPAVLDSWAGRPGLRAPAQAHGEHALRHLRLREVGAGRGGGGKIPKGVFVAVAEVEPDGVRLDNGMRLKNQELLRATRPSHAVDLRQLPGPRPPQPCHLTLRHLCLKGDELRAAGGAA